MLKIIAAGVTALFVTPLFESIAADMNEEELALSHSTPSSQLAAA